MVPGVVDDGELLRSPVAWRRLPEMRHVDLHHESRFASEVLRDLAGLDQRRELRQRRLPADLVVGGRQPRREAIVYGQDIRAAVTIGERHGDGHLALQRGVVGLEFDDFDHLLVWHESHEVAVVCVSVNGRLSGSGRRVIRERDPERATFDPGEGLHLAGHAGWNHPRRDRIRIEQRAIDGGAGCVDVASHTRRAHPSYATRPSTTVISTESDSRSSAGMARGSPDSTTRSASLPGVIVPLRSSSNEAKAPWRVNMRRASSMVTPCPGPMRCPVWVSRVTAERRLTSTSQATTGTSEEPTATMPRSNQVRPG